MSIVEFAVIYADDMTFSEQNPLIKEMKPFCDLYEESDELGYKIMGGIYRIYDLKSSYYAAIDDEKERIEDVNLSFMKQANFPWNEYNRYILSYKDKCRTELQKRLSVMRLELSEREIFYRGLAYDNEDDLIMKETMRKTQKSYLEEYEELEMLAKEEVGEQASYAGYIKSYQERKAESMTSEMKKKGIID